MKRRRRRFKIYSVGVQPLFGKGQQRLWAVSLAACGKIIIGVPTCLNYCEIFTVYTEFTNVAAGEYQCELFHKRVESLSRLNSWPCFLLCRISRTSRGKYGKWMTLRTRHKKMKFRTLQRTVCGPTADFK